MLPCLAALAVAAAQPALSSSAPDPSWTRPVAHTAGVLAGMRLALAVAWPDPYDPSRLRSQGAQLRAAFTAPPEFRRDRPLFSSDGDPWPVNVAGHGLFGSEVYLRVRQCGHGPAAAALAAAAASTVWEYGVESSGKRPSAVDLVWTPLGGSALGELRFRAHRWARSGGGARRAIAWMVDPLGEAERAALGGC